MADSTWWQCPWCGEKMPDAGKEAHVCGSVNEACRHCGDPIRRVESGAWAHVVGPGSLLYNCQHTVPYGQVAEPAPSDAPSDATTEAQ